MKLLRVWGLPMYEERRPASEKGSRSSLAELTPRTPHVVTEALCVELDLALVTVRFAIIDGCVKHIHRYIDKYIDTYINTHILYIGVCTYIYIYIAQV